MHTPTFLQKASFSWLSWRTILPLLTLFAGLGKFTGASAQPTGTSTASIRNVIITAGTSSASATTDTYNAAPTTGGTGIGGGIFGGTNFGSLDVNAGRLLLQGGTVQIVEADGEVYNQAYINYAVSPGTLTSANPAIPATQSIQLMQTGYDAGTMTRTFALSNAGLNILALATTAGTPGTSYRFDLTVNATGTDANGDDVAITGTASRRKSAFTATGNPIKPTTLTPTAVFVAPNAGVNVTYNINPSTPRPFVGADLSSSDNGGNAYDVNNGQLLINGGSVTTTEDGPNVVTGVTLYFRTRSARGASNYQPISLVQTGNSSGTKTFSLTTAQLNIIASSPVITAGTYNLDVYFQANVTNTTTNAITSITSPVDPNSPYSATFTVNGTVTAQTIWVGGKNDNWFDAANWSNGVPTRFTNVLVRDLGAGNKVPYPNIYSDMPVYDANGVLLFDNSTSGPAEALDLVMGGTSQASRAITRLNGGRLRVFGNFSNIYDSYIQRENTVIEFAGGNQTISGGTFVAVEISGGGTKFDAGVMNVSQSITFTQGLLTTDITQPTLSVVVLSDRAATNNNNGAQLINETDHNYLRGFVRTSRLAVTTGETRTYGNMGMTLTFNGDNQPGNVEVTRNTVESYNPLNDAYSIRRIFGVRPASPVASTGGLNATMVFGYQNIDTRALATGSATGNIVIPEQNLFLFVSSNGGNTFTPIGRDVLDTLNNTLTKYNVTSFATITLGDVANPLPVVLTAFNATRSGLNTNLTWATASEKNSAGFEVQVSTDGVYFRKLAFVNSQNGNSTTSQTYSYLDTEANKSGIRYYRLRQVDTDGTEDFSPVRAVSFSNVGDNVATALSAYPNPYGTSDAVKLSVQTTSVGTAHLRVSDLMGREVANQTFTTVNGVTEVALDRAASLNAGSYMAQVTLPSGEVKTVRIQKR